MGLVDKTIWYIESHFESGIRLEEIARQAGVSRFHLLKAFGYATGYSVMRYVRHRRLTQAARALANGESDILGLALKVGYGSHEAFTRAFRDQFGVTPSQVREQHSVEGLELMEAIRMDGRIAGGLEEPRIVAGKPLLIAGLSRSYTHETAAGIPAQWQEFVPQVGNIPGQVDRCTYGVLHNGDDEGNYDYLSGVEVADFSRVQMELTRLRIPEQRYAVFAHHGHVSEIRATCSAIWSEWLPASGYQMADGPMFERYGESFDPDQGTGGIEVWVPLE